MVPVVPPSVNAVDRRLALIRDDVRIHRECLLLSLYSHLSSGPWANQAATRTTSDYRLDAVCRMPIATRHWHIGITALAAYCASFELEVSSVFARHLDCVELTGTVCRKVAPA